MEGTLNIVQVSLKLLLMFFLKYCILHHALMSPVREGVCHVRADWGILFVIRVEWVGWVNCSLESIDLFYGC